MRFKEKCEDGEMLDHKLSEVGTLLSLEVFNSRAGQGTFQPKFLCNSANDHEIKQKELHVQEEISLNAPCAVSLSGFEITLLRFSSSLLTAGQELSKLHR